MAALEPGSGSNSRIRFILPWLPERLMDAYRRLGRWSRASSCCAATSSSIPSRWISSTRCSSGSCRRKARRRPITWCATNCAAIPTLLGLWTSCSSALLTAPDRAAHRHRVGEGWLLGIRGVARAIVAMPVVSKARQFYWRCPACGGWETYPPKRTEEFDLSLAFGCGFL